MAERVLATLYYWMRTMMVHVGIHENLKTGLWLKFAATATKLEKYYGKPTKMCTRKVPQKIIEYTRYLRTFGEMGFVRSHNTVGEKREY